MKKKVLKGSLIAIVLLIATICGLFVYSEKIRKIEVIENAKKAVGDLVSDLRTGTSEVTVVDVTGLTKGEGVEHEHIYKTQYDETNHWEECTICHERNNNELHNLTTIWVNDDIEQCSYKNSYKNICNCGYAKSGHKECVWDGKSYRTMPTIYAHARKCTVCEDRIYYGYYLNEYGSGEVYSSEFNTSYVDTSISTLGRERCHLSNGTIIDCNNLGTCVVCGRNYKTSSHRLELKEDSNTLFCRTCGNEFGTCDNTVIVDGKSSAKYTITSKINLVNGVTLEEAVGFEDNSKAWDTNMQQVTSGAIGTSNFTLVTTGIFKSSYKVPINDMIYAKVKINGVSSVMGMYTDYFYPDQEEPTILNIASDNENALNEWSKSKPIIISGTENYCDNVTVKILDDEENTIFEGSSIVENNNYTISCTPEIEADTNGRTFTVIVTDSCKNSTSQQFNIAKVDSIAPEVTSSNAITGEWTKTRNFTFTATDTGVGNVSISFNNQDDYKLADKDGINYSKEYSFIGDAYEPVTGIVFYKDELDNISTQEVTIDKIDNTAPTITNVKYHNKRLYIESNDEKVELGEGSGVVKYRYITSNEKLENPIITEENSIEVSKGEKIAISNTNEVKYAYIVAEDLVGNVSEVYEVELIPENLVLTSKVNLEAANGHGGVDLDWSTYNPTDTAFKVYQKKEGSDEWESISTFDFDENIEPIEVLNVYPTSGIGNYTYIYADGTSANISASAGLKVWMEGGKINGTSYDVYGKNPKTGKQLIKVTSVSNPDFNSNPEMIWNYDVTAFGFWDTADSIPDENALKVIEEYIKAGYGVLGGHTSIMGSSGTTFTPLRKYFNIEVGNWLEYSSTMLSKEKRDYDAYWGYMSSTVEVNKKGLITTFPYELPVGTTLTIANAHTVSNAACGDVWMTLTNGYNRWGNINNYYNEGGKGNPCYYLTTYNNTAMIQTGHLYDSTTDDERKILANTLFYLKQISTATTLTDNSSQDLKGPQAPNVSVKENKELNNLKLTYNTEDNGNEYSFKVEAYDKDNLRDLITTSNERTEIVTTGVEGYYYVIDNNSEDIDFDISLGTYIESEELSLDISNRGKYIHIKAIDVAGNVGDETTVRLQATSKVTINLDGGELEGDKGPIEKEGIPETTEDIGTPEKEGYTFVGWETPEGIEEGSEITYPEDDIEITAKWEVNNYTYKVNYYYDNVLDESATVEKEAPYMSSIEEYETKMPEGYKFSKTEKLPLTIGTIEDNNVINVYYVADESQTKELTYTVEYYKNDEIIEDDREEVTETVQLLKPSTLTIDREKANTTDKYRGYKLDKIQIDDEVVTELPETIETGKTIKIYYVAEVEELVLNTEVNLEAANGHGGVDLDWNTEEHPYDPTDRIFRAYQRKDDEEGAEWESISIVNFNSEIEPIKVLNIYPVYNAASSSKQSLISFTYADGTTAKLPKSASLKVWMEGGSIIENGNTTTFEPYGINPITGQQLIDVTPVSSTDFNNDPEMIWNYDIIMFGTWDANGYISDQPNDIALNVIEKYIKSRLWNISRT